MKIFQRDFRHGFVKVEVENLDDLWYLSNIVRSGDLVRGVTVRKVKGKDDMVRSSGSERKTVSLTIRVEKVEFKSDTSTLRIHGTVTEGPEDVVSVGSYHTFNVEDGTVLSITKEAWFESDVRFLDEAKKSFLRPKILIAIVDEGEVNLALLRDTRIDYYDLSKAIGGKYDTRGRKERKDEFYREVAEFISQTFLKESASSLIIAGAGFEKEYFHRFLAEKYSELAQKSAVEHIGSHGRNGVLEVIKKPALRKMAEEVNTARDLNLVNALLEHVGRDTGLGVYGLEEVRRAADSGAVETLLLADNMFLEKRSELDGLMRDVQNTRGMVHIVNHENEAGVQLNSLGGVAALLRYRLQ